MTRVRVQRSCKIARSHFLNRAHHSGIQSQSPRALRTSLYSNSTINYCNEGNFRLSLVIHCTIIISKEGQLMSGYVHAGTHTCATLLVDCDVAASFHAGSGGRLLPWRAGQDLRCDRSSPGEGGADSGPADLLR